MHVAITGAGLMGCLLNWHLAQRGHEVILFEKSAWDEMKSASYVAASMLAPCSERIESSERVWRQGLYGLQQWPQLLRNLNVPYGMDGSIVVAHGPDIPLLQKFADLLRNRFGIEQTSILDREGIQCLEPQLAPHFQQGLFLPLEGWLDNRELLKRLQAQADIHFNSPKDPSSLVAQFDVVVDCRGIGAKQDETGLRAVRGEVVRVFAPEVEILRPVRLMHPKYQLYIAPRRNHEYVIGATQLESNSEARPSVQSVLELLSAAFTVHSGFAEAEVIELASGLRAAYADNDPRIHWRESVLSVNGLYRHGYLIAPAIVEQVIGEVEDSCTFTSTAIA